MWQHERFKARVLLIERRGGGGGGHGVLDGADRESIPAASCARGRIADAGPRRTPGELLTVAAGPCWPRNNAPLGRVRRLTAAASPGRPAPSRRHEEASDGLRWPGAGPATLRPDAIGGDRRADRSTLACYAPSRATRRSSGTINRPDSVPRYRTPLRHHPTVSTPAGADVRRVSRPIPSPERPTAPALAFRGRMQVAPKIRKALVTPPSA